MIPERYLRRWDPVTVFFDSDTGPPMPQAEDHPERYVRMSPPHPGAFTWLNARTLQFRPAEPWPPLSHFAWRVGERERVLTTLMAAPVATVPQADAVGLPPVDAITLTFAEPLDPAALARMVTIELQPLPGVGAGTGESRWLDADDFRVKVLDRRGLGEAARYVLLLNEPVGSGMRAVVNLRLSLDDTVEQAFKRIGFATAAPFRALRLGCANNRYPVTPDGVRYTREQAIECSATNRAVELEFSAPPGKLGPVQARNLVRFTPAVRELSFTTSGNTLDIRGRFQSDTLYRVSLLPAPLSDETGRVLQLNAASELYVHFPPEHPFLSWEGSQGIVERYGPQMVPLRGRGYERLDVRIYPVDPLDRSFWPFPEQPVAVDESQRPPGPGERPGSYSDPRRFISAQEIAGQIRALGSPAISQVVALPLRRSGPAAKFGLDLKAQLARINGAGQPGSYLVGVRRLDEPATRSWIRLQVTDLSLTAVEEDAAVRFAVTSLATGEPVAGAQIRIEGPSKDVWAELGAGTTDAEGVFHWSAPGWRGRRSHAQVRRIVVQKGKDVLVLDPTRPPERYADNQWSPDRDTWLQWTVEPLQRRRPETERLCHLFTERPVYRPDEAVHIKGYFREREEGRFRTHDVKGALVVAGPGQREWRYPITWTPAGSFYHEFREDKLPTGTYNAYFQLKRIGRCGSVSFQKEAYRIPRFEVQLHAPDIVSLDQAFKVTMTARYYAGGRAAGRPVRWRVTQFPYTWTPEKREGFLYSSDGRFSGRELFRSSGVMSFEATTDEEGAAVIDLDPAIEPTAQPRSYVVEATVVGADDQTVSNTRRVIALPPLVLGLKAPRYVERAGSITPEIIVVGPDGKLIEGQPVKLRLLKRQWHSHLEAGDFSQVGAKYVTEVVDEKVLERTLASGTEPLAVKLPVASAGVYVIELETHDALGRAQVVSLDLYVGGDEPVTWSQPPAKVFRITPDKPDYAPGDIARLVLESPFQRARALAIVEAPEGNRYQWLDVRGGAAVFELPIDKAYVPSLPVHFVLMRGRTESQGPPAPDQPDLHKPATVAATTRVPVSPVQNRLAVAIENADRAQPGEEIEVQVRLADQLGKPLPGEVTLWLVDQAVLALGKEQRLDMLPDFIKARDSRTSLRDTRNLVFGYLPLEEQPGGGVGEPEKAALVDKVTVRRNFEPVPYFNPTIAVGRSGVATVKVKLPDNLTVFKLRAKAVSGPGRFGHAKGQVAVRLPVIVQPSLPRFVRPRDRFTATAIGRVVEGPGGPGLASVKATGLTLEGADTRRFDWVANRPQRLDFAVQVPTPEYTPEGEVSLEQVRLLCAVQRTGDGARDAFEVVLPLRPDRSPVRKRLIGDLAPGASLKLPEVSESARPGTVRRTLLISDQPALVRMAAGLSYLMEYPYGCTEQRLSRARAYVGLKQLTELLHGARSDTALERVVNETLQWTETAIDANGLVAYWPGSRGYVSLTAWVVEFMVEARDAGFAVNEETLERLTETLRHALRSDYRHFITGEAFTERTMALSALAAAGQAQGAYVAELARKASYLNLESIARVLRAIDADAPGTRSTVEDLMGRLREGLVFRLHEGREIYGGLQKTASARNALILPSETRTVAEVLNTLAARDPTQPRVQVLVDALVTLGGDDGWGSTNASASALLALSRFLGSGTANRAKPQVLDLQVDGRREPLTLPAGEHIARHVTTDAGSAQLFRPPEGEGPLVVQAETRYLPVADGSQAAPAVQGFVVSRELLQVIGEDQPLERIPLEEAGQTVELSVGAVIEDHVQVVNNEDRTYVAVVVPLAAGLEPLNPRLATAPPEARTRGQLTRTPAYVAYLDDHVAFYYDSLPKGNYDFYFRTRATIPGSFIQPGAYAEMMYQQAVNGSSAGARIDIQPAGQAAP